MQYLYKAYRHQKVSVRLKKQADDIDRFSKASTLSKSHPLLFYFF